MQYIGIAGVVVIVETKRKCRRGFTKRKMNSIASQAVVSLGRSIHKGRGVCQFSCLATNLPHTSNDARFQKMGKSSRFLQYSQILQMQTALRRSTSGNTRSLNPLLPQRFYYPKPTSMLTHRNYSSDENDPSVVLYEFNQLLIDLSSSAFDLSFEELTESFHVLQEKMSQMSEHSIGVQDEEFFLETVQKLMSTCSRQGTIDGVELVERFLSLMLSSNLKENSEQQDTRIIGPTRKMFTIALDSWSELSKVYATKKINQEDALMPTRRVRQILDFMWEEYEKDKINAVKPDIIHYTSVLKCLANASSRKATWQAQSLLKEVERKSGLDAFVRGTIDLDALDPNLVPDRTCYNTILYCLAQYFQSRNDNHVKGRSSQYIMGKMKEIMERMEFIAERIGDDSWMPNTATYNLLLMACSRRPNGGGAEAEKILQVMIAKSEHLLDYDDIESLEENHVVPTVKSYNHVINAWSHSNTGYGAERAEEILKSMLRKTLPAKSEDADITESPFLSTMYPDVVTFNLVLNAYARSGLPEAGMRSEIILNFMNDREVSPKSKFMTADELKLRKENLNLRADVISFNSVINAYSKGCDNAGAERAQALLDQMLNEWTDEIVPNSISFSTVMQAWAKSSDPECGLQAEKVFEKLNSIYLETGDIDLRASESCYHALISAWCNQAILDGREDSYEKALEVLRNMEDEGGYHPKTVHYNLLLSIPGKSRGGSETSRFNNAMKARCLLMDMGGRRSSPDIHSFNHIFKGFQGFVEDKYRRSSLFAVLDTFNHLCESDTLNPNAQTYIHLLKVVQDSLEEESIDRSCLCEEIFRKCCEAGLLTNAVLVILSNLLPSQSMKRLQACRINLDPGPLTVYTLPPEWSENRRVGQNQNRTRKP